MNAFLYQIQPTTGVVANLRLDWVGDFEVICPDPFGVTPAEFANSFLEITDDPLGGASAPALFDLISIQERIEDVTAVDNDGIIFAPGTGAGGISDTEASPILVVFGNPRFPIVFAAVNDISGRAAVTTLPEAFVTIPEPSTFALAALGLLSLSFVAWRRRSRA